MNKQEFITSLYNRLSGLPQNDIENSIEFYSEMIDDRIEEGLTEEEKDHFSKCLDTMLNNSIKAVEKLRNEK